MDSSVDLTRDISTSLSRELETQFTPGESVVISLPGSVGEALVVTDRRVFILRERIMGLDPVVDVFAYPLGVVQGARALSSESGGYIELKLAEPASNADSARVYFPPYDEAGFKAAAEYLSRTPAAPLQAATTASSVGGACPACQSEVEEHAVFCGQCGAAVRSICLSCGSSAPIGSKYCLYCGKEFIEYAAACAKCGARVLRSMAFCTQCGSIQRPNCAGCGTPVMPDWKYCAGCGRVLDSNRVDPRAVASTLQGIKQWAAQRQPMPETDADAEAPAPPNSAEAHNQHGKEHFNNEDYESAAREFGIAVTMEPNNGSYHCNLGLALDELDRDSEAVTEYQRALELNPNDLAALLYMGYMHSENDEPDKAQQVWQRILAIAPDSAEAQEVKQNLSHQAEL
jgi:tetratricopeptide (TPR) repeat protein